jgi:hypothetical protein
MTLSLVPSCRMAVEDAVARLEEEREAERWLLAGIEEIEALPLGSAARAAAGAARRHLLAWLAEARRCTRVWREHLDQLAAVVDGTVQVGRAVVLTDEGAAALERIPESGFACHSAATDLVALSESLRLAEILVALRAAVAEPRGADVTMAALGAILASGPGAAAG